MDSRVVGIGKVAGRSLGLVTPQLLTPFELLETTP